MRTTIVGARNRIEKPWHITVRESHELTISLLDLPLAAGTRPAWTPTGFRLSLQWGDTWPSEGARILHNMQWPATADNQPITVILENVTLHPRRESDTEAVVDTFGQRLHAEWPTKIHDAAHFAAVKSEEDAWLSATPPPPQRSRYGGWTGGPNLPANGFFQVVENQGRWWYVDPEGYPFWSIGTTGIRVSDTTQLEDRESLFDDLPRVKSRGCHFMTPIGSPANDGRGKEVVSFYLLNCLKKFGNLENWRDHVVRRFQVVGFNTAGNWSDELIMAQREVPHTRALETRLGAHRVGSLPDVFDPEWSQLLDDYFAKILPAQRDNPWLVGYFVDNEMGWGGAGRVPLTLPEEAPCRQELIRFATEYFNDDLAAAVTQLSLSDTVNSWSALLTELGQQAKPQQTALMQAYAGHFAERYFSTVASLLKRHDPNHLYLGCRFVRRVAPAPICAAAGRHCDVVTVNCYDLLPRPEEFSRWHALTGRPIQIGEHHLPLRSERQLPPLYPAFTADEREQCYEDFVRTWAEQPYSVGCHWFQHTDQNATGRPSNGENQTVGFVDITDQPHPELIAAAMRATREMYAWHHSAPTGD